MLSVFLTRSSCIFRQFHQRQSRDGNDGHAGELLLHDVLPNRGKQGFYSVGIWEVLD